MMARLASRLALGIGLLLAAGCGGDEPPPHQVYPERFWYPRDGSVSWPDYGPPPDFWSKPREGGHPPADASPGDGNGTGDGQASCAPPAAAKCPSACAGDEVCTEANGGACAKSLALAGSVADKSVLRDVALAYVRCWAKEPAEDTLCYAFNTCAMTGVLTEKAVSDWVCQKAGITDFPSPDDYNAARGICKCSIWQGQFVYRPDWKVGTVAPGKNALVCMSYDKNPWYSFDRINVDNCSNFPPN
jgi:hypothetical protein